ncbi:molecular chaperone DnaJ [Jatrophihabitans sp.]|uniref:molecular chaperone DnaJ n=1 Tax=Jatrophihabitans sp. TaxID=1932789 RepID=UPI0030C67FB3|nr:molecular chaperone DnaJ [Jatrophihabitans sp.]
MSAQDYVEKDYYAALGVAKTDDAATIKKAYRKLARENHPDANPNNAAAEARFKEVSEAYDVLSDTAKRQEYDEARSLFGGGGYRPSNAGRSSNIDFSDLFGTGSNVGDMFSDLFGPGAPGGRRASGPPPERGADLSADVQLGFEEAVHGATLPLKLSGPAACRTCGGSGAAPGSGVHTCPVCGGVGAVSRNQGGFAFREPCRECRGAGQIPDTICPECRGTGSTNQTRTITVRVPAGVRDGAKLRIAGKGSMGVRGGPAGDLFVTVRVAPHPLFGRSGDDLTLNVPVSFTEATLGTSLRVPTLDGAVTLKVAPGTPSGRTLRVRGRGVATAKKTGDLLVTVEVAVPTDLSDEERDALEKYQAVATQDPRPLITAALSRGGDHG